MSAKRSALVALVLLAGCTVDLEHRIALERRIRNMGEACAALDPENAAAWRVEAASVASDTDLAIDGKVPSGPVSPGRAPRVAGK